MFINQVCARLVRQPTLLQSGRHMSSSSPRVLKAVTLDVTGTLIYFKGTIGEHYCTVGQSLGYAVPTNEELHSGFKRAYSDIVVQEPCFGYHSGMQTKDWWKMCVRNSFAHSGHHYSDNEFDTMFEAIYKRFGSSEAYALFDDVVEFLAWCKSRDVKVGILSNGTERYRDEILPLLGVADYVDFWYLSKVDGVQKPDPRCFEMSRQRVPREDGEAEVQFHEMAHIGDSFDKDWVPAEAMGMEAILLDRFAQSSLNKMPRGFRTASVQPDLHHAISKLESLFAFKR